MKTLTFIQNMKLYVKKKKRKEKVLRNVCNLFLPRTLSMLAYTRELLDWEYETLQHSYCDRNWASRYNETNAMDLLWIWLAWTGNFVHKY